MAAISLPDQPVSFTYLERLTDDFGIWQHTHGKKVEAGEGYALDDSARALLVALQYDRDDLITVYGEFVRKACCDYEMPINFFSADRKPVFQRGWSDDALGQVWWALGLADSLGRSFSWADQVRNRIRPVLRETTALRPLAYACLSGNCISADVSFAERILALCAEHEVVGWYWPEDRLIYANAIFPYSLLEIGERQARSDMVESGLRMLDWLNITCSQGEIPIAIGNKGWYPKNGPKALYDQQPIDPAYQVLANAAAYRITGNQRYYDQARRYLTWFWGNNVGNAVMIDSAGGCFDGIQEFKISKNRGAENIVCYLLAHHAFSSLKTGTK